MRSRFVAIAFFALWFATPAQAHRLDEYLQAATFSVQRERVVVHLRLTPGVEVLSKLLPMIDADGDGIISDVEQRDYVARVGRDVTLTIDGQQVELRTLSFTFPKLDEMKQGLGDISIDFEAKLPPRIGERKLGFENHHQNAVSVYLANCLVPDDSSIRIIAQDRNYDQSHYELRYMQLGAGPAVANGSGANHRLAQSGSASLARAFVYQGIHHILTGYDHLLFVSALVLAATTLWDLVKVVSAFTLAHTLTLTLAALNLVHVSERIVEPLIAASIVFVAMQNLLWPKQAKGWSRLGAAFFFGLFHGLGFAGGLLEAMQQMQPASMLLAICAFSVGVEAGHQMVVLPLFGLLKAARHSQPDAVKRTRVAMAFQRIGSAGISLAGAYYLCLALVGSS